MKVREDPCSAEFAMAAGRAAMQECDFAKASRWLDRAFRMTGGDPTVGLLLSSTIRPSDPLEAMVRVKALIAAFPDFAAARIALLTLLVAFGEHEQAASECSRILTKFAPPDTPAFYSLADDIVRAVEAPGWIGLDADGAIVMSGYAGSVLPAAIDLDGSRTDGITFQPHYSAFIGILPAQWRSANVLTACLGSAPLLGSGLPLLARRESTGFVSYHPKEGLHGHAWLPADPDKRPLLTLEAYGRDGGRARSIPIAVSADQETITRGQTGFRFVVPAEALAGFGEIRILAETGRDLWGSPVLPFREQECARSAALAIADAFQLVRGSERTVLPDLWRPLLASAGHHAALVPQSSRRRKIPRPGCDVIIPVHDGLDDLRRCLASLSAAEPPAARVIVVDDGSTDPLLRNWLDALARSGAITLARHVRQRGYPASVNTGLALVMKNAGADAVLLNSDTVVAPRSLQKLHGAVYAGHGIGSATPLSDDGSIVSPGAPGRLGLTEPAAVAAFDVLCGTASEGSVFEIPTAVGFCMYIKRACLDETGGFRDDVFAQGYGEENDWCLRARALGWRHVAATDTFVAHLGGRSFGPAKAFLMERNALILNRLHPGYDALVQDFIDRAPLRPAWRAIDQLRWRRANENRPAVLLITHNQGGGVQRHVADRCAAFAAAGLKAFILSPAHPASGGAVNCELTDPAGSAGAIGYDMPGEITMLAELLQQCRLQAVEIHHLLGHTPEIAGLAPRLGVPSRIYIHDYGYWCPRYNLLSTGSQYCGEPTDTAVCDHCVADLGTPIEGFDTVAEHRIRATALIEQARSVVTPSRDVQERIRRHFPQVQTSVTAWEPDGAPVQPPSPRPAATQGRVVVVGAIGPEKGFEVILACARDAARRVLPLEFYVAGFTTDDSRLMATGKVFITGRYEENEVQRLIATCQAGLGWVPSVTPETWCYALSALLEAELDVVAFDIGTQAERIKRSRRGSVLPLGTPAFRINDFLLAQCSGTKL